jgi:hypothetical protein
MAYKQLPTLKAALLAHQAARSAPATSDSGLLHGRGGVIVNQQRPPICNIGRDIPHENSIVW